MDTLSRVERRKIETKERILATCQQLFFHDANYETVTMREIASKADVSIGAVYLHFHSKEEILATLFTSFVEEQGTNILNGIREIPTGIGKIESVFDTLRDMIRNPLVAVFVQLPVDWIHFPDEKAAYQEEIWNKLQNNYTWMLNTIADVFRQAMDEKTVDSTEDPMILTITLLVTYHSLTRLFFSELKHVSADQAGVVSLTSVFDTFRRAFLHGIIIKK